MKRSIFSLRFRLGILGALLAFCCLPALTTQAQTGVYTYGLVNVNEGGHVLCEDRVKGVLYIGGHRNDSTLILKVDYNGNLIDEATFKFGDATQSDFLADLKYDLTGSFLIGCGTLFDGTNVREGYAFQMNPGNLTLNWSRTFTSGNLHFAPVTIHDIALNANEYYLTGTSHTNEDAAFVALNKGTGLPLAGSMHHYDLANTEQFNSSVILPNNSLLGTGRLAYTNAVTTYRPGLLKVDPSSGAITNETTFLVNYPGFNARIYPFDLTLNPDSSIVVGEGDFISQDGNFSVTNAFMTINESGKNTQNFGHIIDVNQFVREGIHEVIQVPGSNPDSYIMFGQGIRTNGGDRQLWLMSITRWGVVNWAVQYGGADEDFLTVHQEAQQQMIPVNAGVATYAFTATTKSFGQLGNPNFSEDILLVLTDASGQIQHSPSDKCIEEPIDVVTTPQVANDEPQMTDVVDMALNNGNIPSKHIPPVIPEHLCASCWAAIDDSYLHITTPTTLNANSTVTGVYSSPDKVFVGANIVVDGIVLDITEADIVFAPCTRITFINGARLRANNSTFRPCEETDSWDGLYFTSDGVLQASGVVNECIFKNAVNAFEFSISSNSQFTARYDLRLTNNLFVNCLTGIAMPGASPIVFQEGITGNTFTVDNRTINWTLGDGQGACNIIANVPSYVGIGATNTTFLGQVSQNDFVNTSDATPLDLVGVFWTDQCTGRITLNNFTNNLHAVQLSRCFQVSVENNRMELTQLFPSYLTQTLVSNCSRVWVTGNHIVNTTENLSGSTLGAAISIERGNTMNVKENIVDGFNHGIQIINATSTSVNENHITNCNNIGIYAVNAFNDTLSCNEIKMRLRPSLLPQTAGIFYRHLTPTVASIKIKGNCVTDADVAIWAANQGAGLLRIPRMHNNYLYNYKFAGVNSVNFNGAQGSGILTPAAAGRNTFVCNNLLGGAWDVRSNQAQTWYGNFGISTVTAGITIVGNGVYQSIASCGLQIGTGNSTLDNGEICDLFMSNYDGSFQRVRGGDYRDFQNQPNTPELADFAGTLIQDLISQGDVPAATAFLGWIESAPEFTSLGRAQARYAYASQLQRSDDMLDAARSLASLDPSYRDLQTMEQVRHDLVQSGRSYKQLTSHEIETLSQIDDARLEYAADARDMLHAATGRFQHVLYPIVLPDYGDDDRKHDLSAHALQLFPNPAKGQVTVDYAMASAQGAMLRIYDATGRIVFTSSIDGDAASITLDIAAFAPGIYMVALLDAQGQSTSQKLLIQ